MQDLEQAIRERAYHLWIADGCRDGNANEHWLSAQRENLGRFTRKCRSCDGRRRSGRGGNEADIERQDHI
jgi:hypothetical protein